MTGLFDLFIRAVRYNKQSLHHRKSSDSVSFHVVEQAFTNSFGLKQPKTQTLYRKSSIKPPGGLFISSPFEAGGGGLIEKGGLFKSGAYLI